MKPILEMDITEIIEKSNRNKSPVMMTLVTISLKRVAKEIMKPLTLICQYQLGLFLISWKYLR